MAVGFEMKFEMPGWLEKIERARGEINLFIAATMQTNRGQLFDSEGANNGGQRWAPLVFRKGQILSDRGNLRKSLAPTPATGKAGPGGMVSIADDTITIGTNLYYASMMNDGTTKMPGGVLRPVNAQALKIPLPGGVNATDTAKSLRKNASGSGKEKFIFRKSVRIPARPFDRWTQEDEQEMSDALTNKILEVMSREG